MSHKMCYEEVSQVGNTVDCKHSKHSIKDEEMVKLAFRALDKDGSGQVSTTEFKHLMTHIGIKFSTAKLTVQNAIFQGSHSLRRKPHGSSRLLIRTMMAA